MVKTTKLIAFFFGVFLVSIACNDAKKTLPADNSPDTEGIGYVETTETPTTVYNALISILNANENIGIVAEVNHSENASNAGSTLEFTRTIYFGNPALGTPLMQDNIQAGLDLPQRIAVYIDENGDTVVAYNSVNYVVNRHKLGDVATIETITNALANIVNSATGEDVILIPEDIGDPAGIITVNSPNDIDTTYDQILNTLHSKDGITVMAELDHQANAAGVDMDLPPTKLIIFGNPALGTPLMKESRTAALDLPQKMLIYEDTNGEVKIIYNDIYEMADRHDIEDNAANLDKISNALQNIAASGAAE
jgi:uncharacterized protein (DUF302 family)